jgi:hypothetical protein
MRTAFPWTMIVLVISLFGLAGCASTTTVERDPLALAYFDEASLLDLMAKKGCVGLRFYNARRSADDAVGTALVIPIDKDTCVISGFFGPRYMRYDHLSGSEALIEGLSRSSAKESVDWVRGAGGEVVAVDFRKEVVKAILDIADANALRVWMKSTDAGVLSMAMGPVKLADGAATIVGTTDDERVGAPCPNICGKDASCYLHRE